MKRAFAKQNRLKNQGKHFRGKRMIRIEGGRQKARGTQWPAEFARMSIIVMIPATRRPTTNAAKSVLVSRF
jgi:hypothetical protein